MQGHLKYNALQKRNQITRYAVSVLRMSQHNSAPADFIQLFCRAFSHPGCNTSCSLLPQRFFGVKHDFRRKAATTKTATTMRIFFIAYPFGSMPCLRNSALANSFSQLPRLTPSRVAAAFNCSRNSGAMRIWKVGDQPSPFCDLSRLIVDTYVRNPIVWFSLRTYVITIDVIKTTPRTVGAVPRRLTKPLSEVTVMACKQHTQTRPKYQYRFLALSAIGRNVIHITATTEHEAREQSPAGCVMVFAGRLPVQEVSHA